jgi:hypothetical protein
LLQITSTNLVNYFLIIEAPGVKHIRLAAHRLGIGLTETAQSEKPPAISSQITEITQRF